MKLPPKIRSKMEFMFWDIETGAQEGFYWDAKVEYMSHAFQEQCTTILSAAWKHSNGKRIYSDSVNPARPRSDKQLVIAIHKQLMRCADENIVIVHQNGDKFDIPKIAARIAYYRLAPVPKLTTIDTLKKARQIGFDYKRLDYLDKYLHGDEAGKVETRGWQMWRDILSRHSTPEKREKALKEMVHYNKGDIVALERVFTTLRPYMQNFPNANMWGSTKGCCPNCGSNNVVFRSQPKLAATRAYRRLSCNECGYWFRETKSIQQLTTFVKGL